MRFYVERFYVDFKIYVAFALMFLHYIKENMYNVKQDENKFTSIYEIKYTKAS